MPVRVARVILMQVVLTSSVARIGKSMRCAVQISTGWMAGFYGGTTVDVERWKYTILGYTICR